jgi:hypothetical protein
VSPCRPDVGRSLSSGWHRRVHPIRTDSDVNCEKAKYS